MDKGSIPKYERKQMGYLIKRRWLIGALAGLIVLSACSETSQPDIAEDIGQVVPVAGGGSYVDIIPSELDKARFPELKPILPLTRSLSGSMSSPQIRMPQL
jgi:hypothetical protein